MMQIISCDVRQKRLKQEGQKGVMNLQDAPSPTSPADGAHLYQREIATTDHAILLRSFSTAGQVFLSDFSRSGH